MNRKGIEKEVDEDMRKSYHHLLVDAHEELSHPHRLPDDSTKHALKRIISLFARVGLDSEKAQKRMLQLTYFIIGLAVLQTIFSLLVIFHVDLSIIYH